MLSTAVAYLRAMEERGISVNEAAAHMRFTVSIGANLFLEIAKIRALRELWAIIVKECGGSEELPKSSFMPAPPSWTLSRWTVGQPSAAAPPRPSPPSGRRRQH